MSPDSVLNSCKKSFNYIYCSRLPRNSFDWSEPELLKGPGAVKDLPALVKSKGISSVLVVTDKGLMSLNLLAGLFEQLDA